MPLISWWNVKVKLLIGFILFSFAPANKLVLNAVGLYRKLNITIRLLNSWTWFQSIMQNYCVIYKLQCLWHRSGLRGMRWMMIGVNFGEGATRALAPNNWETPIWVHQLLTPFSRSVCWYAHLHTHIHYEYLSTFVPFYVPFLAF